MEKPKRSFIQFAEQKLGRVPEFFIYAVLEWMIILILFIDGFLAVLANELAKWFGLPIPCLLCTRIDHALVGRDEQFYYNDSICNSHKKNVSCLAFCHAHKKLSDVRNLCENCLLSFATEKESDGHAYKSLLGILHKDIELFLDEEQQVHLSLPTATKDEVVQKSKDHRCACCGEPLKLKSSDSKWKASSLAPAPSPHAALNLTSDSTESDVTSDVKGTTNEKTCEFKAYTSGNSSCEIFTMNATFSLEWYHDMLDFTDFGHGCFKQ